MTKKKTTVTTKIRPVQSEKKNSIENICREKPLILFITYLLSFHI